MSSVHRRSAPDRPHATANDIIHRAKTFSDLAATSYGSEGCGSSPSERAQVSCPSVAWRQPSYRYSLPSSPLPTRGRAVSDPWSLPGLDEAGGSDETDEDEAGGSDETDEDEAGGSDETDEDEAGEDGGATG
jgi:hypothetical protein